jgi:hypothetical protein
MNMLAQAIAAQHGPEVATYAWVITKDHLADEEMTRVGHPSGASEAGVIGPRNAPTELITRLKNGEGDTFKMFDDDGILYYTGRGLSLNEWDEDACYGPLGDFGTPNAGAVLIEWPGHNERDCG